jgi:hypothetical protein
MDQEAGVWLDNLVRISVCFKPRRYVWSGRKPAVLIPRTLPCVFHFELGENGYPEQGLVVCVLIGLA